MTRKSSSEPTEADLLAEWEEVESLMKASLKEWEDCPKDHWRRPLLRRRYEAARADMAETRKYWRGIGEMAPEDHPGHRKLIKTVDNDGSILPEGGNV